MGVSTSILSDTEIQSKSALAEALIVNAVPGYADITGDELTFLQSATVAQVCALLCPGMPNRIKVQQADETLYSFKLQSVDWSKKKTEFEAIIKDLLSLATGNDSVPFTVIGVVNNDRLEV